MTQRVPHTYTDKERGERVSGRIQTRRAAQNTMAHSQPHEQHRVVTFTRIQLAPDEPTPTLAPEVADPRGWKAIFEELTSTDCEITNGLWTGVCGRIEERQREALLIMRKPSPFLPCLIWRLMIALHPLG